MTAVREGRPGVDGARRRPWREAASFLTTVVRTDGSVSPEALSFFPAVGFALGLVEGGVWRQLRSSRPALVASTMVVLVDLALTGGLHLDGLADAADGLFAHVPAKDRLEIMSEPAIGTYGATALIASFVSRVTALSAIDPSPALLAAVICASRSLMVAGMCVLPPARDEGLSSGLAPRDARFGSAFFVAICSMGAAIVLASRVRGRRGALGLVAGLVAGVGVLVFGRRRLGGHTGDVLGAAGAVCEVVGLLALAR